MRMRILTIAAAFALIVSAAPGYAQGFVSPYVSASFSGDAADNTAATYGVSAGWLGGGVVGFEFDLGWSPEFFGNSSDFGDNNVTTFMGNLLVGVPVGNFRPYVAGGAGLLRQRLDGIDNLFHVSNNDFGMDVGAGVMGFFNDNIGLRGDVRYFRSLQDPQKDNEFDIAVGNFDFWRATVGVAFRF